MQPVSGYLADVNSELCTQARSWDAQMHAASQIKACLRAWRCSVATRTRATAESDGVRSAVPRRRVTHFAILLKDRPLCSSSAACCPACTLRICQTALQLEMRNTCCKVSGSLPALRLTSESPDLCDHTMAIQWPDSQPTAPASLHLNAACITQTAWWHRDRNHVGQHLLGVLPSSFTALALLLTRTSGIPHWHST